MKDNDKRRSSYRMPMEELRRRARLKVGKSPSVYDYAMSTAAGRERYERAVAEWQRVYHQRRNARIKLGLHIKKGSNASAR